MCLQVIVALEASRVAGEPGTSPGSTCPPHPHTPARNEGAGGIGPTPDGAVDDEHPRNTVVGLQGALDDM